MLDADPGHPDHVQHDGAVVGQLDAGGVRLERRAGRRHQVGHHVHRLAGRGAAHQLLQQRLHLRRRPPVVVHALVGRVARWRRCALLGARGVLGVAAGVVEARRRPAGSRPRPATPRSAGRRRSALTTSIRSGSVCAAHCRTYSRTCGLVSPACRVQRRRRPLHSLPSRAEEQETIWTPVYRMPSRAARPVDPFGSLVTVRRPRPCHLQRRSAPTQHTARSAVSCAPVPEAWGRATTVPRRRGTGSPRAGERPRTARDHEDGEPAHLLARFDLARIEESGGSGRQQRSARRCAPVREGVVRRGCADSTSRAPSPAGDRAGRPRPIGKPSVSSMIEKSVVFLHLDHENAFPDGVRRPGRAQHGVAGVYGYPVRGSEERRDVLLLDPADEFVRIDVPTESDVDLGTGLGGRGRATPRSSP